jgi:general secretion pathway protein G
MKLVAYKMRWALTLVEMLIVIAILGILAAIIVPEYSNCTQKATESAAKKNLQILRSVIERYAVEHDGVPPGYSDDDPTNGIATPRVLVGQLVTNGHYLSEFPQNPFNEQLIINMVDDGDIFPTEPILPNLYGWIYQPESKTIKLNWPGTDSEGIPYFNY